MCWFSRVFVFVCVWKRMWRVLPLRMHMPNTLHRVCEKEKKKCAWRRAKVSVTLRAQCVRFSRIVHIFHINLLLLHLHQQSQRALALLVYWCIRPHTIPGTIVVVVRAESAATQRAAHIGIHTLSEIMQYIEVYAYKLLLIHPLYW